MNAKFASNRTSVTKQVAAMRLNKFMSWADIAAELSVAPRTARRLFQERLGEHQHHDHLPSKGGRYPSGQFVNETIVTWVPDIAEDEVPVLDNSRTVSTWVKLVQELAV
jgi:hypothetical protein